jgi:hypothetical protein
MNKWVDVVVIAFVVGGILVLTRPGSQGPSFVRALGGAFSGLLATATGQITRTPRPH